MKVDVTILTLDGSEGFEISPQTRKGRLWASKTIMGYPGNPAPVRYEWKYLEGIQQSMRASGITF